MVERETCAIIHRLTKLIQGEQWNKIVEKSKKHALNKIDLRESMYVHNFLNLFLRLSSLSERVKVTYPKNKRKKSRRIKVKSLKKKKKSLYKSNYIRTSSNYDKSYRQ